ncbi:hypothetical protein [Butyrivibrio sp. XPD2002]|uniref:hypothetical protein n=1 Tax=Butyrivibrio sp. XPD2002 TaxID=1280665 RepID=UPI00047B271F|nr:hypothetical protein [Butyrivibrio sp. XPD2002]
MKEISRVALFILPHDMFGMVWMQKMADALIDVLDASIEDNNENMETVEINGNKFVYEKGSLEQFFLILCSYCGQRTHPASSGIPDMTRYLIYFIASIIRCSGVLRLISSGCCRI